MAAATVNLAPNIGSDAAFRALVTAIRAQLAAVGWIQTADTGQINPATVTTPGASNTSAGYEIWRMADALQATAPVYMKIEYGSDNYNGNGDLELGLWVTVGTGADGAGNLTGKVSSRIGPVSSQLNSAAIPCYFSGDTNRFAVCLFRQTGGALGNQIIAVERTHDANGADTNEGVLLYTSGTVPAGSGTKEVNWQALRFGVAAAQSSQSGPAAVGNAGQLSGQDGADVAAYPMLLVSRKGAENPLRSIAAYWFGDFNPDIQTPVTIYGIAHNFMTLGGAGATARGAFNAMYGNGTLRNESQHMMRYE